MEGKLVARTVSRLAEKEAIEVAQTLRLQQMLKYFDELFDGLGFCLSEERDLLSQWRGYAEDGKGVCIGFSKDYLEWLEEISTNSEKSGFRLHKVRYEPDEHEAEVAPAFAEAKRLIEEGAFNYSGKRGLLDTRTEDELEAERKRIESAHKHLSIALLGLLPKLYLLKTRAFQEEREWRLLSHLVSGDKDCSYRVKDHQIIPFRAIDLCEIERMPIVEVILGPKHVTPVRVIEQFLQSHGLSEVRVLRSEASYR